MPANNTITLADLSSIRSKLSDKSIVLGTGCFDLLHIGHLYFLQEAKKQGDLLVIGLNSDSVIKTMKGPLRPIVPEEHRLAIIAAIRYVDIAFIYDDDASDECIRLLRPNVYSIGEESVHGYPSELNAARNVGANIHIVQRVPELSTTAIVATVHSRKYSDEERPE